ncbi:MAG: 4-(cytidine 5'-diphospho)-2-C-methyl-D-erythritol kinase [Pseudomonadota bacterium]
MTGEAPGALRLAAPAKVNLYLHVTGRRADGYHLLDSLIAFTALSDQLELGPADGMRLTVEGAFADNAGPLDDNLVLRAARALADVAKVDKGMAGRLVKNIPAAAGLGGGSADAAAALRGLMRLWDIPRDTVDLPTLALELGADIPVCLAAGSSFVGGVGEQIEAAPALPETGILLVNPGVALATPSVFAGRRGGFSPPGRFSESPPNAKVLAGLLGERDNDLTEAAIRLAPVIADVLAALESAPGCHLARMTGSGATCFGLFDDEAAAAGAAGALRRDDWWVWATHIV